MNLSYKPLTAPITVPTATHHIHLFLTKSICSFLLERLIRKMDRIERSTPIHWHRLSLSPKKSMAPTRTITGLVAFIGPTIVIGMCFIPKYPAIHDVRTITALIITSI